MQVLIELVNLIQHTKLKANGLLEVILEPGSRMGQLFEAISNGKVHSDEDIKTLFPEYRTEAGRLATLKSKLKDRLTDSVFLLGYKENNYADRHRAFFECTKKWASAMILINKNARINGIHNLTNLLRHTQLFEFTELTLDILRVLRLHYGLVVGDVNQYNHYDTRLRECEAIWTAESQIESLYTDLVMRNVNTKADKSAITATARAYHAQVQPLLQRFSSFKVQMFGRLIETVIYDCENDYEAMIEACERAIRYFENKNYQSTLSLQVFYYNLVICYLVRGQFAESKAIIYKFEGFLEEGSFNWFKVKELYFFTAIHARDYQSAFQTCRKAVEHPFFENLPAPAMEIWKILEAYTVFLIYIGLIQSDKDWSGAQQIKFRLNRFLNEVPVFSKDKRGMNIPVLIIQYLYLLADGKYDACEERAEALNKYRTRYLNDNGNVRSNCFFKMLAQIPASGFDAERLRLKSDKLNGCLAKTPWYSGPQSLEIEVIPYEQLQEIVFYCLQKDHRIEGRPFVSN